MYHEHQARQERGQWRGCGAWKNAAQYGFSGRFSRHFEGIHQPQTLVNIRETADYYELFVFAPGLSKDAFNVSIADDVLVISTAAGNNEAKAKSQWIHHEYQRNGFERRFQLNNKIETEGITARYNDGVLELMLPKAAGTSAQEINVA
jgi:HSP20 family molecular chaperone IbpA